MEGKEIGPDDTSINSKRSMEYHEARLNPVCARAVSEFGKDDSIENVVALVSIHRSMTFLADMYGFLNPPSRTVLFSVDDR